MKYALRSGSAIGLFLEKIFQFIVLGLRGFTIKKGQKRSHGSESGNPLKTNEHLLRALRTIHQQEPIEEIVVFDICELPIVLKFAEPLEIGTLIR